MAESLTVIGKHSAELTRIGRRLGGDHRLLAAPARKQGLVLQILEGASSVATLAGWSVSELAAAPQAPSESAIHSRKEQSCGIGPSL